jgi:hypothetical protein
MATIYRCDRCNKESPSRNEFARVEIPYVNNYSETDEQSARIQSIEEWNKLFDKYVFMYFYSLEANNGNH